MFAIWYYFCPIVKFETLRQINETQALYDRAMRGRIQEKSPGKNTDVLRPIPGMF